MGLESNYVEPEFLVLAKVTLTLITDIWIESGVCLDLSYPYTNFAVNRSQQTKVIKWKLNFYF